MNSEKETHKLRFIKPKPNSKEIYEMVKSHFDIEASTYDEFDSKSYKRKKYTESVNRILSEKISGAEKVLSIACGTGRRDIEIRSLARGEYEIDGVEISSNMAKIANSNGLNCICGNWNDVSINQKYDYIFFLYAFGAIPSSEKRLSALKKASSLLKKNGVLFLDVLNLDDVNEWGPEIKKHFLEMNLESFNYEEGDILYSKTGDDRIAFWHYFSKKEIQLLLEKAGFHSFDFSYIGYGDKFGEIVGENEGAMLISANLRS